mmetsp:Transcript_22957/g.59916  ORF Transcript_22957/g.59916 Transcript_22957/m.59916 type:complete len:128 (-) Transcript_22957:689-1072(-)
MHGCSRCEGANPFACVRSRWQRGRSPWGRGMGNTPEADGVTRYGTCSADNHHHRLEYSRTFGNLQLNVTIPGGIKPASPSPVTETFPLARMEMTVTEQLATDSLSHADGGSCSARITKYLMTFPWQT